MKYSVLILLIIFLVIPIFSQKAKISLSPDTQKVLSLLQNSQFVEAEKLLREIVKKEPKNFDAQVLLGTVLIQVNKSSEGIIFLKNILKSNPYHIQANYNLALFYSSQGDARKAIPYLERAAGITAQNKNIRSNDAILLLALTRAYITVQRNADATKIISKLESAGIKDLRILFTLGVMLADLGNYEKAAAVFQKVDTENPNTFEVLYNLGIALYNLDRLADAQTVLQKAAAADPARPEVYYRLGLIYSALNDSDGAVSYWLKALELKPDYDEANFLIGEELLKNRKVSGALPYYQKAVELKPDNILYKLRVGVAYFRTERYTEAKKIIDEAVAKYPQSVNFNFLKGYIARAEGLFDDAITSFEKVLKLSPDNPDVLANLGYIALERGETEKAEQLLKKTLAIDGKNFSAHYDLGRLLNRQKKYVESVKILEAGATMNANDPGVRYQLFISYSRLKQKDKADAAFAEFKRLEKLFNISGGSSTSNDAQRSLPALPEEKP